MSLVRDALAKAEREAAAHAAREHGLPAALAESAQPFRARRRRWWPWALGLAAAALAGAAATALLDGARGRVAAPVPPAGPPPAAARAAAPAGSTAASGPATASALPAAAPALAPPALAPAAAVEPGRAATFAPPPAAERPARFVRELPLGEGRSIRLGGIAWSASAPLAYLNGRLVGVGENVEGHRVTRIERDRVTLDDGARRVVLALR